MTDETGNPMAAPRIKRPYVRKAVREEEVRQEPAREPVRAKTRLRKGGGHNLFGVPKEILSVLWNDYGVDLQWNLDTVKGADGREINDLPFAVTRGGMEQQGWESVLPGMFGGILDGMHTRQGHQGETLVGGQVLQWRPKELTLEARAEEQATAKQAIGVNEKKLASGQIDGVDSRVLDPRAGSAQGISSIKKTRVPTIPVPS